MILIRKADGTEEEFSEEKLLRSVARAGVPSNMQKEVAAHVRSQLYPHIPTSEIYKHIVEFLDKSPQPFTKARFSLKQSIMDLGPTGFPFEQYIAKVLAGEGYENPSVHNMVQGTCVMHEIDIIASKNGEKIMVEAKFHNSTGIKTDIHVALYTKARFDDIAAKNGFTKPMLVTNTKLSTEAVVYAQCVGMDVLGWSYPQGKSLSELVEKYGLFPLTALSSLPKIYQQQLLQQGIVLCMDLCLNPELIMNLDLPEEKKKKIADEVKFLCGEKMQKKD